MLRVVIHQNWTSSVLGDGGYFVTALAAITENCGYFLPALSLYGETADSSQRTVWLINIAKSICCIAFGIFGTNFAVS
jgi:hypothetical protein